MPEQEGGATPREPVVYVPVTAHQAMALYYLAGVGLRKSDSQDLRGIDTQAASVLVQRLLEIGREDPRGGRP